MNRIAVAGAAAAGLIGVLAYAGSRQEDRLSPSSSPDCETVVDETPGGAADHRTGTIHYGPIAPTSGAHNPSWLTVPRVLRPGGTPEDFTERAVHNLEHGYVVVWYDPATVDPGRLAEILDAVPARKVLGVPWERGAMTRPFVLAAWGHRQECTAISERAVTAFFDAYGGRNGQAPEPDAP